MRLHVKEFIKKPEKYTLLSGKKEAVKDGVKNVQEYTMND